jgi:hypothetical protein
MGAGARSRASMQSTARRRVLGNKTCVPHDSSARVHPCVNRLSTFKLKNQGSLRNAAASDNTEDHPTDVCPKAGFTASVAHVRSASSPVILEGSADQADSGDQGLESRRPFERFTLPRLYYSAVKYLSIGTAGPHFQSPFGR